MFNFNHTDENYIVRKMMDGDIDSLQYLFGKYFRDLSNFVNMYLHSKELSEEIALEIFEYVWEKRESIQLKNTFKSFLFVSAKYKAISCYRKEHKAIFYPLLNTHSNLFEDINSETILENKELKLLIEEAIAKLPPKSREIYQLAWEDNLSYREIGEKLGITTKTVENHVGIALRKLRESLKPYYDQIFFLCCC